MEGEGENVRVRTRGGEGSGGAGRKERGMEKCNRENVTERYQMDKRK